jgi:hypothetical protein
VRSNFSTLAPQVFSSMAFSAPLQPPKVLHPYVLQGPLFYALYIYFDVKAESVREDRLSVVHGFSHFRPCCFR